MGVELVAGPLLGVEPSLAGYSPLAYVAVWGPAIAAVAVVWSHDGRRYLGHANLATRVYPADTDLHLAGAGG